METPKVIVLAELTILPQFLQEARVMAQANLTASLKEPGCEVFIMTTKKEDPNTFVFFEIWASAEALNWHMETSYAKEFLTKIPQLLAKEPALQFLEQL